MGLSFRSNRLAACFGIAALFCSAAQATQTSVDAPTLLGTIPAPLIQDSKVHLRFSVTCNPEDKSTFPGMVAEANFRGRILRFNLFQYENETDLLLGVPGEVSLSELSFRFLPSAACSLRDFVPTLEKLSLGNEDYQQIAIRHAPYLMIRADQISRPDRDVHLGLAYSILPYGTGYSLRYTYFFSNETVSGLFSTTKAKSLGSWGRRSDIEWVYQVDFAKDGHITGRRYQGGLLLGLGHKTHWFNGRFLPGTDHPVLYDIAKHNVFGINPAAGTYLYQKIGVQLMPTEEIKAPLAREHWLWERPWTFEVTDRELKRDGQLTHPSSDYLYVDLKGSLNGGRIQPSVQPAHASYIILAGEGSANITGLGGDLWGVETFSAIHLDDASLALGGNYHLKRSTRNTEMEIPHFYRLIPDPQKGFAVKDVSSRFSCSTPYDCAY